MPVVLGAVAPEFRGAVVDPKRRGAVALVGLALVGALAAGALALRARPRATVVPRPVQRVEPVASSSARQSATPLLVVDVAGAVRRPGLQRLPTGSRVADALAAAGGAKPGTSTSGLNLARKLIDGEQVVVGAAHPGGQQPPAGAPAAGQPLDLNAATLADLDQLAGVGPVLAQRIISWRQENGGFTSVDQLREVEGIGERTFASLRAQVTV